MVKAVPFLVGTWLSLVEHSLGVRGVGSSNLPVPTNHPSIESFTSFRISAGDPDEAKTLQVQSSRPITFSSLDRPALQNVLRRDLLICFGSLSGSQVDLDPSET